MKQVLIASTLHIAIYKKDGNGRKNEEVHSKGSEENPFFFLTVLKLVI